MSGELMSVRQALLVESVGASVSIQGWVRTKRTSKAGLAFLEVNDGSSLQNLQAVVPESLPDYESVMSAVSTGASVILHGDIVASPAAEQDTELHVQCRRGGGRRS